MTDCTPNNLALIAEEFEILQSIYENNEIKFSSQTNITINLDLQKDYRIELWLPNGYPSQERLKYSVNLADVGEKVREKFGKVIDEIIDENENEGVLFQVIEAVREEYENMIEEGLNMILNVDDERMDERIRKQQELETRETPKIKPPPAYLTSNLKVQTSPNKITDRKSIFQGHLVRISKKEDIDYAKDLIYASNNKIPTATHNIAAYRVNIQKVNAKGEEVTVLAKDYDDDGETGAGSKLLALLDLLKVDNVFVIVTRWYGGILLGPDRFKHIKNCAKECLEYFEVIESNSNSGGKKK